MPTSRPLLLQHKSIILKSALILLAGVVVQVILYSNFGWFQPFWWPLICVGLLLARKSRISRVALFMVFMHYYFPLDQKAESTQFHVFPTKHGCFIVTSDFSYRDDPDFYYQIHCYYVDRAGNLASIFYWRRWAAARPVIIHHANGDDCLFFNAYNHATLSQGKILISQNRDSSVIDLATLNNRRIGPSYYQPPYRDMIRILFQE